MKINDTKQGMIYEFKDVEQKVNRIKQKILFLNSKRKVRISNDMNICNKSPKISLVSFREIDKHKATQKNVRTMKQKLMIRIILFVCVYVCTCVMSDDRANSSN